MVLVPAGIFVMGTSAGDRGGDNVPRQNADAQPQHTVVVSAFAIDKTEVTNAEYKRYCEATGYPAPPHWVKGNYTEGDANMPVTHVNWWEASAYADWVGKRLPTEAEWEKAARGTDGRTYPWGDEWELSRVVFGQTKPQPVGSKPSGASPYGALDMAGNVLEWVSDWYMAYPEAPRTFPEYGTTYKVARGGGFSGFNSITRTYYRSVARPSTRSEWIGFRCVKDVK
jgi:formylglycine-generating enzyme required for sulfatase activity